jgi:hypothetical protein
VPKAVKAGGSYNYCDTCTLKDLKNGEGSEVVLDMSSIKSYYVKCQIELTCFKGKLNKLDLTKCHVSVDSRGDVYPHLTSDAEKCVFHKMSEVNSPRIQTK